jgi:serine/threonine protein kinase
VTVKDIGEAGYSLGHTLGEGRFSQVVLGTHDATGELYAVKVVDVEDLYDELGLPT